MGLFQLPPGPCLSAVPLLFTTHTRVSLLLSSPLRAEDQPAFLPAPIRTVSAVARALCLMLLQRKGVSDGSSQARASLSWTSCRTPVGLTFGTCHHHRLISSVMKPMNLIHSVRGDVCSPPKGELSPWPCKTSEWPEKSSQCWGPEGLEEVQLKFWVLVNLIFIIFWLAQPLLFSPLDLLITIHMHGYIKQRDFQLSPFCLFLEVSFWPWSKKGDFSPRFWLDSWIFLCFASEDIIVPSSASESDRCLSDWEIQGTRHPSSVFYTPLGPCFQMSGDCLEWSYLWLPHSHLFQNFCFSRSRR